MTRWGDVFSDDALTGLAVVEQAQIAVVALDRFSRVRYWNGFARELFDFASDRDYRGLSLYDLGVHQADHGHTSQLTSQVLKGETWDGMFAIERGDGSCFHVRAQAVPMRQDGGEVDGVALLIHEALRNGRVEELYGLLDRVGKLLASSRKLGLTLKAVAEILAPQFADHCFVDLFERDRLVRRISVHAAGWTPPRGTWFDVGDEVHYPERHFVSDAIRRVESVVLNEVQFTMHDPSVSSASVTKQVGVTSAIAVPLQVRGEVLGVLTLALSHLTHRDKRIYEGFDRDLVGAIASRMAIAIDNARLFEEERDMALAFQNSLLPTSFPQFDGISLAHRYLPAKPLEAHGHGIQTQVGGDFYDVIPLSAGRVGIVVGDVEGRGTHAAAVMGQLRAALRAFAQADREPADILRELDEWVRQLGQPDGDGGVWIPTVSCLYMVYDAWSRELSYANAGHMAPLLINGGEVSELGLEVSDTLLGVKVRGAAHDDAIYHQAALTLPPGGTLVLYTDGLVERRPLGGTVDIRWSLDQLHERVREVADKDVEQIAEVAATAVPGEIDDDTALLVVRSQPEELALEEGWFNAEAPTVGEARHLASTTFARWGMDRDQAELACLLVSEIVTNVVIHAAPRPACREFTSRGVNDTETETQGDFGPLAGDFDEDWSDLLTEVADESEETNGPREFLLRLRRGASLVWVEVFDHDLRLPRIRSAGADDEGGRGLYLVDQLATRWGSRPTPEGKAVWFEVPMRSA